MKGINFVLEMPDQVGHDEPLIPSLHHLPVHNLPELVQVGGAAVLIVQIVGVLPDVEGQNRLEAVRHGVVGACILGDGEFAGGIGLEPHPAGAEEGDALCFEGGLEGIDTSPLLFNPGQETAGGGGQGRRGRELRKVQLVVQDLAGVVEDGGIGLLHDLLQGHGLEGSSGDEFVQIVHIGLQMLAVVEFEGLGADGRLEGGQRVREFYKRKHLSSFRV